MLKLFRSVPGAWLQTITGTKVKMTKANSNIPCVICGEVAFLVNGVCSRTCQNSRPGFYKSHNDSTACHSNRSV